MNARRQTGAHGSGLGTSPHGCGFRKLKMDSDYDSPVFKNGLWITIMFCLFSKADKGFALISARF